jgi:peptidoglycan L-alanyl-D-glutamate endopeptidase CwlK
VTVEALEARDKDTYCVECINHMKGIDARPIVPKPKLAFSRDITHCHIYLQTRWPALLKLFREKTNMDLIITCTWRSEEEQLRLWKQGRTEPGKIVTNIDGYTKKSMHNFFPSKALDVAIDTEISEEKVKVSWNEEHYKPLIGICESVGLVSGGSWQNFKDWPHVELPKHIV